MLPRLLRSSVLGVALLAPAPAAAQAIEAYRVNYYFAGGVQPFQVWPFTAASVRCDQTPEGVPGLRNPIGIEWTDPDRPGRACQYDEIAGGPLFAMPIGNYELTLVAINAAGASGESNRAPFALGDGTAGPPPAPLNVRVFGS
jgi:hypothetical protein